MERTATKWAAAGAATALALLLGLWPAWAQEGGSAPPGGSRSSPTETLTELKEKIGETEALIESTREKERAVLEELEASDRKLEALRRKADQAAQEAAESRERARALEAEASALRESLERQEVSLAKTLRRLYRHGSPSMAEVLLSSSTLTEAAERATYSRKLARMDRQRIARYRETLKELAESRRRIKATTAGLIEDQQEADHQAGALAKEAEAKRALLASIQRERQSHEKAQQEMEEAAREVAALIERLDEKQRDEGLFSVENERDALARQGPFNLLKGRLPWPIEGRLLKTSKRDALLHKGIYIEARQGEAIEAVAKGTVVFADYFRGYGNLCIIDHGSSYHTLYAHARELNVRVGERVERGQAIGRAGSSGAASTPRLYFELRHRGRPLNPMPWMAARSQ